MWWRVCWGRPGRRQSSAPAPAWAHSRSRGLPRPPARVGADRPGAPSRCPSRPAPPAPRPTGRAVLRTTPAWKRPLTRPVRKGLAPRDPASQFYQWSRGPIFGSGARSSTNRAFVCPPGWRHSPTPPTARAAPPSPAAPRAHSWLAAYRSRSRCIFYSFIALVGLFYMSLRVLFYYSEKHFFIDLYYFFANTRL